MCQVQCNLSSWTSDTPFKGLIAFVNGDSNIIAELLYLKIYIKEKLEYADLQVYTLINNARWKLKFSVYIVHLCQI